MADLLGSAAPGGLLAGGTAFALPSDAQAVPPPGAVRPVPGGPPGLLGLVLQAGRAVLVWAFEPAPAAWVFVDAASGPMVIGGAALITAPPGAPSLVLPNLIATTAAEGQAPRLAAVPLCSSLVRFFPGGRAAPMPTLARPQTLTLWFDGHAVTVPIAVLDGIRPMPAERSSVPGGPICDLGYAETVDGPVLLLDPAWCAAAAPLAVPLAVPLPGFVAVLQQAGRRFGVPCTRAEPGAAGIDLTSRLGGTPEGRRALDLAPLVRDVPSRPAEAQHSLLLCRAAGLAFAVAAEEVAGVMPPRRLAPAPTSAGTPIRWVCAHRGDVLPVLDATERLGASPTRTPGDAPLLRLALPHPVALAVTQVLGLRSIVANALTPVDGDPLVAALAMLDRRLVPVCRAAAFAGMPA